jgi:hypothetical protein
LATWKTPVCWATTLANDADLEPVGEVTAGYLTAWSAAGQGALLVARPGRFGGRTRKSFPRVAEILRRRAQAHGHDSRHRDARRTIRHLS